MRHVKYKHGFPWTIARLAGNFSNTPSRFLSRFYLGISRKKQTSCTNNETTKSIQSHPSSHRLRKNLVLTTLGAPRYDVSFGCIAMARATIVATHLNLYFDGACEPKNPGGLATYGWAIFEAGGPPITPMASGRGIAAKEGTPQSTNNFAEYCALGFGLRHLLDVSWKGSLLIYGDSQLVINQINGTWKCNKEHLRKLRDRCRELIPLVSTGCKLEWIPREENEFCDALSQRAYEQYTGKKFPVRRK